MDAECGAVAFWNGRPENLDTCSDPFNTEGTIFKTSRLIWLFYAKEGVRRILELSKISCRVR